MKETSPSRGCGEVTANGIKSAMMKIVDFIKNARMWDVMSIITIGIDLAKNIFAVHGVNEQGKAELVKPKVQREQLPPLIANLPPCPIGCTNTFSKRQLEGIIRPV